MRNINLVLKIRNLKFQILGIWVYFLIFPVNSFQNRRIVKRYNFYIRIKLRQLRSRLIFYTPWKHQRATYF